MLPSTRKGTVARPSSDKRLSSSFLLSKNLSRSKASTKNTIASTYKCDSALPGVASLYTCNQLDWIVQMHAPHLCIVVLPDTPRYFVTSQIKSLEVDTSQLQFLKVTTACCKPGRQDNAKQDIQAANYLRCRVLGGLMLRKSLVLEHMHQSCLTSIVQTLQSDNHDSIELSRGGGLVRNIKTDIACSSYQK